MNRGHCSEMEILRGRGRPPRIAPPNRPAPPVPGFYVAHHRQLDPIAGPGRCFKLGRTNNLRRRLLDQAFVTCFAGPFSFIAHVETPDLETAQMIESEFLHRARNRRFMQANGVLSELVLMTRGEILGTLDDLLRTERMNNQIRLNPIEPFEVVPPPEAPHGMADLNNEV